MLEGSYRLSSSELRADESKMGRMAEVVFLLEQRMIEHMVSVNYSQTLFWLPGGHSAPPAGQIAEQQAPFLPKNSALRLEAE